MSATRQVTVWCDECARWEQGTARALQLRRELRRQGWTNKGKKDFCPDCSTKKRCTCGDGNPADFEGPRVNCPEHGHG